MIDIKTALENILKARYGRDVRQSIHDAIAQENDNLTESREFVQQKAQEATQAAEDVEQATTTATKAAEEAKSAAQSAAEDAATIAGSIEAAAQSATDAAASAQTAADAESQAKAASSQAQTYAEQASEYMAETEAAKLEAEGAAETATQAQADASASKDAAAASAETAQQQANDAKQAARDAETARTGAELAQANAQTAAQTAADAAVAEVQQQLEDEVTAAQAAAESAQGYSGKPPIIQNSNWWTWDAESGEYINTGKRAVLGIDKTYSSLEEMQADHSQEPNTVGLIQSGPGGENNGELYIYNGESWQYMADLSGFEGVGIRSIELTDGNHTAGTFDTYTITLTDRRESTFTVWNGKNGEGSGDMLMETYDPSGIGKDIFKYADEAAEKAAGNVKITMDAQPTESSENAVQSGGTYAAIQQSLLDAKNYTDDEVASNSEALETYKTTNDTAVKAAAAAAADAKTAADSAQADADAAMEAAQDAQTAADGAQETAEAAGTAAKNAQKTATEAGTAASNAQDTAESAESAASEADRKAQAAQTAADSAATEATAAKTAASEADEKAQAAQTAADEKVSKSGDTMSGVLNMGSHLISGLAQPVADTDAATKKYVDDNASSVSGFVVDPTPIYQKKSISVTENTSKRYLFIYDWFGTDLREKVGTNGLAYIHIRINSDFNITGEQFVEGNCVIPIGDANSGFNRFPAVFGRDRCYYFGEVEIETTSSKETHLMANLFFQLYGGDYAMLEGESTKKTADIYVYKIIPR